MTETTETYRVPIRQEGSTIAAGQPFAQLLLDISAKRRAVRLTERLLDVARAKAEQLAIDAKGGDPKALGSNESDRKRALLLLIEEDVEYVSYRGQLEAYQSDLERLTAELEIAKSARRDRETETLDRLSAALSSYSGLGDLVLNGRARS